MLDADTKVQLTDMSQAIQDIEFEDLEDSLQNNTVTVDFNSLRSSLSTAATAIQGESSLTATYVSTGLVYCDSALNFLFCFSRVFEIM